jgi:hypothetical protein
MLVAVSFLSLLYGCGGGSSNDGQSATEVPGSYVFPAGKSVITFSAISTARLRAPMQALDISLTLPQGMGVATVSGVSGQVADVSVTAGSALTGTNLAFGSYSESPRTLNLSMVTTSSSYRIGEFLRVICDVSPSAVISLNDLRALNNPVIVVKAVGYDPISKSTVQLTDNIKVTVGVSK